MNGADLDDELWVKRRRASLWRTRLGPPCHVCMYVCMYVCSCTVRVLMRQRRDGVPRQSDPSGGTMPSHQPRTSHILLPMARRPHPTARARSTESGRGAQLGSPIPSTYEHEKTATRVTVLPQAPSSGLMARYCLMVACCIKLLHCLVIILAHILGIVPSYRNREAPRS